MDANKVITLARKHIHTAIQEDSARVCLADAVALYDKGDHIHAALRALKSLAYSVGVFHDDYKRGSKAAGSV